MLQQLLYLVLQLSDAPLERWDLVVDQVLDPVDAALLRLEAQLERARRRGGSVGAEEVA